MTTQRENVIVPRQKLAEPKKKRGRREAESRVAATRLRGIASTDADAI